jgi:hypothetical protein
MGLYSSKHSILFSRIGVNMPKFPTQKEFMVWRKKHPKTGKPMSTTSCPIAKYLRSHGFPKAEVGLSFWTDGVWVGYNDNQSKIWDDNPKWATKFIMKFDDIIVEE